MHFSPNTVLVGTATLLFTATTVHASPLPPHNTQNNGPLVPFCNGPLGIPLICPPSVPDIYSTPGIVIPDSANNGIEHGGEVSEKGPVPEVAKEKIEPRSDDVNNGVEQHGGDVVYEVSSLHRANGGKEKFPVVVTYDSANGGRESTIFDPEDYNNGIEHDGQVSEKDHGPEGSKENEIEPRSENDGVEQQGGQEVRKVPSIHRGPVVFPNRANGGKERLVTVVTDDSADGGREYTVVVPESNNAGIEHGSEVSEKGHQVAPKEKIEPRSDENHGIEQHGGEEVEKMITVVLPASYNDSIEHGNDEIEAPASYNDGSEHGGKVSEQTGHQIPPKQEIESRSASPDFGQPRYVSVAEDHWGKWQGNDAWFATPRVPKDKKVGP